LEFLSVDLKDTLNQLTELNQLEAFGKTLSSDEMLKVLDLIGGDSCFSDKLNPILAGLRHEVFFEILHKLSLSQLNMLQHESMAIPIQHHLTALSIQKLHMLDQISMRILAQEDNIKSIQIENLGLHDLTKIYEEIEFLINTIDSELISINQALSLAWNSDRIDLIDRFNVIKESIQKIKNFSIGNPTQKIEILNHPAGLYAQLNEKLNQVYADGITTALEMAILPAIEALAKLSIWYVEDYYKLGLLPDIQSEISLNLDPAVFSENERAEHLEKLIAKAKKALEDLGLITLDDLKKARIYSKKALQEYITEKTRLV
jgi:hypothetical protein